ncbi:hypothetical protein [Shimia sp. SDUM112013]|uniref:hypothetical protein n=1 Tax=Shimia sp. SDUM112013 TaxID=3136160 RepID=UPI0032F03155
MTPDDASLQAPGAIQYRTGERLLADWRPEFGLFAGKLLLVAGLTLLMFGPLIVTYSFWAWLVSALGSLVIYVFLFDDHLEWIRRRDDVWLLTDQRLIFANSDAENSPAYIELAEITRIRRWMWWAVHLRLDNGMTVQLKYLPNSKHIQSSIRSARDARTPPFPT